MTESFVISPSNSLDLERPCPVFLPHYPGQGQYGPFRASEGGDSRPIEIDHPLQVVAGRHHLHRKIRSRLTSRANQLPAHLRNDSNPMVTPLLASRHGLVPFAFALDVIAKASGLELGLPGIRKIPSDQVVARTNLKLPNRVVSEVINMVFFPWAKGFVLKFLSIFCPTQTDKTQAFHLRNAQSQYL